MRKYLLYFITVTQYINNNNCNVYGRSHHWSIIIKETLNENVVKINLCGWVSVSVTVFQVGQVAHVLATQKWPHHWRCRHKLGIIIVGKAISEIRACSPILGARQFDTRLGHAAFSSYPSVGTGYLTHGELGNVRQQGKGEKNMVFNVLPNHSKYVTCRAKNFPLVYGHECENLEYSDSISWQHVMLNVLIQPAKIRQNKTYRQQWK